MKSTISKCSFTAIIVLFFLLPLTKSVQAQIVDSKYSKWMANSIMDRRPDRYSTGWNYQTSTALRGFEELWDITGDSTYYEYIKGTVDYVVNEDGSISGYNPTSYNIDNIREGTTVHFMYRHTETQKYKIASDALRDQLRYHPRTSEGGFWHKQVYPNQMWLDGLYMGSPYLAEYGLLFDREEDFNDVVNQIGLMNLHGWDPVDSLYYHGWDDLFWDPAEKQDWSDPVTGCSPTYWGRAMGWYAMAVVDVLDFLPEDYDGRDTVICIMNRIAKGIKKHQHECGLWYQVLHKPDSTDNYVESSVSCMFTYSLAKAVRKGYIDGSYWTVAEKAYEAILDSFITVDGISRLDLNQTCLTAGLGYGRDGTYHYYIYETFISVNDPKAIGPFINACLEIEKSPFSPSHLSLDTLTQDSLVITWKDNSLGEKGYILVKMEDGETDIQIPLDSNVTRYADLAISPESTYKYKICAHNYEDTSVFSDVLEVTTLGAGGVPTKASDPYPEDDETDVDKDVTLTWSAGYSATSHDVYLGTTLPPTFVDNVTDNSYPLSGLENEQTYFWRIDEVNAQGTRTGDIWTFTVEPDNKLMSHWELDETEGTVAYDYIGSAEGTLDGAGMEWDLGFIGNALDYTNATDTSVVIVDAEDSKHLSFGDHSFSVSLLAKIDPVSHTDEMYLILKGDHADDLGLGTSQSGNWYAISTKAQEVRFTIDDNVDKIQLGVLSPDYPVNEWTHIVGVRDTQKDSTRLYINGQQIGALHDTTGAIITDSLPLVIGNYHTSYRKANGPLDDIKIFNYALTSEEIKAMYEIELVAHYPMDESTGTHVPEIIGNADGTLTGTGYDWCGGVELNAIDLADADPTAIINVETEDSKNLSFGNKSFTISLLAKIDPVSHTDEMYLILKGDHADDLGLGTSQSGNWYAISTKAQEVRFTIDDNVDKIQLGVLKPDYPVNEWAHIVGVRDRNADSIKLYFNGQKIGALHDTAKAVDCDSLPLVIGNYHTLNRKVNGPLDEIKIFNYALSDESIEALYEEYFVKPKKLMAHYPMDEAAGTYVPEIINNAYGTIVGPGYDWCEGVEDNALDLADADPTAIINVETEDSRHLSFGSSSFSVSLLAKIDPVSSVDEMYLLLKGDHNDHLGLGTGQSGNWYALSAKFNELRFTIDDNVDKIQLGVLVPDYPSNSWAHIVGVRDRDADSVKLYLNGQKIGALLDTTASVRTDSLPLVIGNYHTLDRKINGSLDDIKIFNYALTDTDIETMYEDYFPVIKGLIAHYPLDQTFGTYVPEILGGAYGTLTGLDYNWSEGVIDNCIDLTLADPSTVINVETEISKHLSFEDHSFSVSLLAKIDPVNNTNEMTLLLKGDQDNHLGLGTEQSGNWYSLTTKQQEIRFTIDDNTNKMQLGVPYPYLPYKGWNHIVGVRNAEIDSVQLYVNGILAGALKDTTGSVETDSLPIVIGNYHFPGRIINGALDEIKIWDTALSAMDVKNLFDEYNLDINNPPIVDAGADLLFSLDACPLEIPLNGTVVDDDAVGNPIEIEWSDFGEGLTILDAQNDTASVLISVPGDYSFVLMADDGEYEDKDTVNITVVNAPPTISVEDVFAPLTSSIIDVKLFAEITYCYLPNGYIYTTWSHIGGTIPVFDAHSDTAIAKISSTGEYKFLITVNTVDNIVTDTLMVTVYQPVTAHAGPDITETLKEGGNTVALEGVVNYTYLPHGTLTVAWTQPGGSLTITNADKDTASVLIPAAGQYTFVLTADDGETVVSDTMKVTIEEVVVNASKLLTEKIRIYPNPATHLLNIAVPVELTGSEIKLMSSTGRTVLHGVLNKSDISIPLDNIAKGAYIVSIRYNEDIVYREMIIVE